MSKTKLDQNNPHHQMLIALFAMFVDDYGYTPRELFQLIESSKKEVYFALQEMANERVGTNEPK